MTDEAPLSAEAKDEISWRLMREVRKDARKRGVANITEEDMTRVFKRHSRRICAAVRHESA